MLSSETTFEIKSILKKSNKRAPKTGQNRTMQAKVTVVMMKNLIKLRWIWKRKSTNYLKKSSKSIHMVNRHLKSDSSHKLINVSDMASKSEQINFSTKSSTVTSMNKMLYT